MELVLFIGIQASGKSSFYRERFFNTHVRINLDMLKTLNRERLLMDVCLKGQIPCVIDKMNLTRPQRARYIVPAKTAGFAVRGYFFLTKIAQAQWNNAQRAAAEQVPPKAIDGASLQLEPPARDEGFDQLFSVRMDGQGGFVVADWKEQV